MIVKASSALGGTDLLFYTGLKLKMSLYIIYRKMLYLSVVCAKCFLCISCKHLPWLYQ